MSYNNRPNFPSNPYSQGMPGGGYRSQSPRGHHTPRGGGRGYGGSPSPRGGGQFYSPRGFSPGFSPNRGPSPQHMQHHQGRGGRQYSPNYQQQSPYGTPGSSPRYQHWEGGNRGRGGRGRGGGGYRTPGGHNSRGSYGGGRGGGVEQYYKHSMVEDPWRTLVANSQQQSQNAPT